MRAPSEHNFETIWGHEPVKRLVRGMLAENRLPHALLLHGPDGVGKRSTAFAIAKMILSSGARVRESVVAAPSAKFAWRIEEPKRSPDEPGDMFGDDGMEDLFGDALAADESESKPEPSGRDESVARPAKKPELKASSVAPASTSPADVPLTVDPRVERMVSKAYPIEWENDAPVPAGHVDLNIIEPMPKSKSIKVDQVRMLQDAAHVPPMEGRYRVILVFGADTITGSAANSLLKFLEEPPSYLVLVLVTDHYHRILETIRSRCASLVCQPVDRELLVDRLVEEEKVDPALAKVATAFSEGRPGRALQVIGGKLLEQRQEVFDARLAIERVGSAALPLAVQRALGAAGGIGPAALLLMSLARDRLVRQLAPKSEHLLVNGDLASTLDSMETDPSALFLEAERLVESMKMEDHPAVPAPQPALELALWPEP